MVPSNNNTSLALLFKRQPYKMAKHTQTICRQQPMLNTADYFLQKSSILDVRQGFKYASGYRNDTTMKLMCRSCLRSLELDFFWIYLIYLE